MTRPLLLPFALLLALAMSPAVADPLADAVRSLDPSIREIRIPGKWNQDGRSGVYRVVVSRSAGASVTSRLFVQWIEIGANGEQSVARSEEIPEFGALRADISDLVAEVEEDGLTIFIEIASPAGDMPANYELLVENDGTYRFGPSSN